MKISEILNTDSTTISLEVFPPKKWDNIGSVKQVVADMCTEFNPAFVSVTYGAGGMTPHFTMEVADCVKEMGQTPLFHLTCVTSTKEKIASILDDLRQHGIENILALRGDIPEGFVFPDRQHFTHANELVEIIRDYGGFCVGGACYPELHPDSKGVVDDLDNLKRKVDAGVDFLVSQLFLDNNKYYDFLERCAIRGINVPIEAGIMPITNASLITKSIALSNATVPKKFYRLVERFGDNPKVMTEVGVIYALNQIVDLIANGVQHIHIYTMNKPYVTRKIVESLNEIL